MDEIVVPTYPTPDLTCRRSSLVNTVKPVVLPLPHQQSSNSTSTNHAFPSSQKIDPVAVAVAAKAARPNDILYRRGSLDATVEYAVAMVNIVDPSLDNDDRNMCPFGTRRDSVCGNESPRSRRRCHWKQKPETEEATPMSLPTVDVEGVDYRNRNDNSPHTERERMYFL